MCVMSIQVLRYHVRMIFFFQAEDGIRYLVRSRGLGDVYKRQRLYERVDGQQCKTELLRHDECERPGRTTTNRIAAKPVSYTHLTLPTSDLV